MLLLHLQHLIRMCGLLVFNHELTALFHFLYLGFIKFRIYAFRLGQAVAFRMVFDYDAAEVLCRCQLTFMQLEHICLEIGHIFNKHLILQD